MLYLLDANILIDANRYYYPIDRVPEFWDWLLNLGNRGLVKIPQEIYGEVTAGNDALAKWLRQNAAVMLLSEEVLPQLVMQVINEGYAPDLSDYELEKIGQDPYLIAYALANRGNRIVVSNEGSRPSKARANRHIPDVCQDFNIRVVNVFRLIQELDFRTR